MYFCWPYSLSPSNMFVFQTKKSYKDEVAHARWEFAKPIKFVDGKSYISVVKFVKACKDQGFKKN